MVSPIFLSVHCLGLKPTVVMNANTKPQIHFVDATLSICINIRVRNSLLTDHLLEGINYILSLAVQHIEGQ